MEIVIVMLQIVLAVLAIMAVTRACVELGVSFAMWAALAGVAASAAVIVGSVVQMVYML